MEHNMEIEQIRSTWQALERQLQVRNALDIQLAMERKLERMRSSLLPLRNGQVVQMLFGLVWVILAVMYLGRNRDQPLLLTMGLISQLYGLLCIILGGITLGLLGRIDPAAPVIAVQERIARLRRAYVLHGMIIGLAWWLFWMPATTVVFGLLGSDQSGFTWAFYLPGTGLGLLGLLGTWWFHHWSRSPKRPRMAKAMENSVVGGSIREAQALLDEVLRFEKE